MFQIRKSARINALVMMAICLILGGVFFCLAPYMFRAVSDENITVIRSVFSSCEKDSPGEGMGIAIDLEDGQRYLIDDSYLTDELEEEIGKLKKGTEIRIKIQNKTGYILDLRTDSVTLMDHDATMKKLDKALALSRWASYGVWGLGLISGMSAFVPQKRKRVHAYKKAAGAKKR